MRQIKILKGFTLVELVIVMVILGILSAAAMPLFINMQREARIASMNGLAGAVSDAANIVQAYYFALGTGTSPITTANGTTVAIASTTVGNGNEGLPDSTAAGIGAILNARYTTTINTAGANYFAVFGATGTTGAVFTINSGTYNDTATAAAVITTNCYLLYNAASTTSASTSPSTGAGQVTLVTSGC